LIEWLQPNVQALLLNKGNLAEPEQAMTGLSVESRALFAASFSRLPSNPATLKRENR
jgi:hypothetical protein